MERCGLVVFEDSGNGASGISALQPVANRPIAHHVVDVLEAAGLSEVVVASSVEFGDEVRQCLAGRDLRSKVKLRYVEQSAPVDLAAGLRLAAPIVGAAACVAHVANGLLEEPLAPFLEQLATDSPDILLIMHHPPASEGRLSATAKAVLSLTDPDPNGPALGIAGVSLFGPGALRKVTSAGWSAHDGLGWPAMAEPIGVEGGTLHRQVTTAWRRYSGDPFELLELNRIALDRLEAGQRGNDDHGNRIEGRVHIDEGASVRSSVVIGPVAIGAEAEIVDAYIGPYTSIGAYARVEGAEVEQSIIAAGASVMHVGCRLAGSVIGQNARIFRDFSLPRAMKLRVAAGAEVALC